MFAFRPLERRFFLSYFGIFTATLSLFAFAVRTAFATSLQQDVTARLATLAGAGITDVYFKPKRFSVGRNVKRILHPDEEGLQWYDERMRYIAGRGVTPPIDALPRPNRRQPFRLGSATLYTYTVDLLDRDGRLRGYVRASELNAAFVESMRQLDLDLIFCSLFALAATALGGRFLSQQGVERIEVSFERLREFTADASHELRGPLTAIASNAGAALREENRLPAHIRERFEAINDASRQMRNLTDDLLLLARSEQPIERELFVVDLTRLIDGVRSLYEPQAQERGIALSVTRPENLRAFGNPDQIQRILGNLVENAIAYTNASGSVRVTCEAGREHLFVRVQDSGVGIEPAQLERIFDRFWRASPAREHAQGNGLGLAIARALARRHGGDISVTSRPGHGSEFVLTLPCRPPRVA